MQASRPEVPGYTLQRLLGSGGMGEVWQARQESLDRPVALKVLLPGKFDERAVARLRREAEVMARVSHPNLVRVFDSGMAGEKPWISMELVSGESLDAILQDAGALSPGVVAPIMLAVAGALEALHGAKLLHRDVKPANIMLDSTGRAVLMDLGLARADHATQLTRPGFLLGTPAYLPLELFRGEPFDASVDFFALGISWWELLVGSRPYAWEDILAAVQQRTDLPPLENRLPPGATVPPDPLRVILRLTGPRGERPRTRAELAAILEARPGEGAPEPRPSSPAPVPTQVATLPMRSDTPSSGVPTGVAAAPAPSPWGPRVVLGLLGLSLLLVGGLLVSSRRGAGPTPAPGVAAAPARVEDSTQEGRLRDEFRAAMERFDWHPERFPIYPTVSHVDRFKDRLADAALVTRLQRAGRALEAWLGEAWARPGFPGDADRELLDHLGGGRLGHLMEDLVELGYRVPTDKPEVLSVFGRQAESIDPQWLLDHRDLLDASQADVRERARELLDRLAVAPHAARAWSLRLQARVAAGGRLEDVEDLARRVVAVASRGSEVPDELVDLVDALGTCLRITSPFGNPHLEVRHLEGMLRLARRLAAELPGAARRPVLMDLLNDLACRTVAEKGPEIRAAVDGVIDDLEPLLHSSFPEDLQAQAREVLVLTKHKGGFGSDETTREAVQRLNALLSPAEAPGRAP